MILRWLTGLIKGEKKREKAKIEIRELKKVLLEDPKFRDEILRELEYRTGRRDLLKAGVLGLLGFTVGAVVGSEGEGAAQPVNSKQLNLSVVRDTISDYAVKVLKPCTCIVAQDGTGDYNVSPGEDASEVIQKAIDYAHKKGGGEVRIREGKYLVNNTIKFEKKDLNMVLTMSEGTILEPNMCDKIFKIKIYPFSGLRSYVSNIIINGGWLGQTRGNNIKIYNSLGMFIGFCRDISLLNVNFVGLSGGALKLLTNWDTHIINCRFFECGAGSHTPQVYLGQDLERGDNTNSCKFIGCRFESHRNFATHLEIAAPSRQNFFDTCKFHGDENNVNPLIYIHGDNWNRNFFVNCSIEWNGGPLIKCIGSTHNPNIFEACLIQNWGYYDSNKPCADLISLQESEIMLVGCYMVGGLSGINAMNSSQVWLNASIFRNQKNIAVRCINSDIYMNNITIRDVGKYGIILKPCYHSTVSNLYIIHSDLDGLSTPAIWVQDKGVKYLVDVDIELVKVPFQFDVKPDILRNLNVNGKLSEKSGNAIIKRGDKSTVVKHGLILKPKKILVSAGNYLGTIWVSDVSSEYFKINCSKPPNKNVEIYWFAEV